MISLQRVARTFGPVHALAGIDLEVGEHEFVAVIGRSGCGKSTLLRLIAGLLAPTSGRILVAGQEVTRPRRDVSLMFQRPALLPWRSVLANVLLPAEVLGLGDHRVRAHELLDLVGLAGFEKRLPHELSGGMQQRVSLCRSLIQSPRVMLMDEPFSALDAITRTELSEELQRIQLEHPRAVVFVTHSIDEAVLLADRIVVLSPRPGRIHEIVDVTLPRPRALGQVELDEVSRSLRGLLGEVTA
ncbi:ABC transporter ATP-binding protein [Lentzea aerocolonigenes]|uniref:ABC transporter ATP-binding protein n=1 Tax=Lentzea aerocolonigenes TaxID=68170 RepID=UPI0004C2D31C|nr:ABC transporter ATP-binding protein [Lentzea aerocolonigenes]MCP2241421.1 NitT/TauT family transport system ATP-binding protein [Lentzea aerocolonigenes]